MRLFKRFAAVALAAAMTFSLVACGGGSKESADGGSDDAPASDMKVAMITDYGDITDQSFNQTTYEASKKFADANGIPFTYYKPEGDSTADRVAMIDKAVADGYNVVVLPGYAFAEAIVETAETYPDVKYIALDVSEYDLITAANADSYSQDNVYSAVYKEVLAGYMAGFAAVKLGYKKLGFLGGMAVPAVIRYGYGFVQGAADAAKEDGLSDVEVKYAYGNQFYGDADITAAMDTWYSGGTEVVLGYGCVHVPMSTGRHERKIHIFSLNNEKSIWEKWFGKKNERSSEIIKNPKVISTGQGREISRAKCEGWIKLIFQISFRDFSKFGFISK